MSQLTAMLIFAAVIIGMETAVLIFRGRSWGPNSIRIVGLSLVILTALILAAPEFAEHRTAAYALLGVVAGYLAGRPSAGEQEDSPTRRT